MSEKFVVGQWVTCGSRIARIDYMTDSMADLSDGQGACLVNMRPFVWQVGRTYRTTLDGVTATVVTITTTKSFQHVVVDCKWRLSHEPYCAVSFNARTGRLVDFETRTDVPHLLPYLAEPPPVAEAATFSEFAEADECDTLTKLLADAKYRRDMDQTQAEKWASRAAAWTEAVDLIEKAIERTRR